MSCKILVVQSEPEASKTLADYFSRRGHTVWQTAQLHEVTGLLKAHQPDLLLLDLHFPGGEWLSVLTTVREQYPQVQIIVTNRTPDIQREMLAKGLGITVFLRAPFTPRWIEYALGKVGWAVLPERPELPRVRVPVRFKITFPYAVLAVLFALAAAFLLTRYVLDSIGERFLNQLVDAGRLSADWMVVEENRMLDNLRLLAHTQGVAEALQAGDAERLRQICLPLAINYGEEAIELLDLQGVSLLSLHHRPGGSVEDYEATRGDASLAQEAIVQKVLQQQIDVQGDKYAALISAPWGEYFYIAGPVFADDGKLAGVVLFGKSLHSLVAGIRQDTLAQISLYRSDDGFPLASTIFLADQIYPLDPTQVRQALQTQDTTSLIRSFTVGSSTYSEILRPWEARNGEDLGVMGVALAQNLFVRPSLVTRTQAILVVALAFLGVIVLGVALANRITSPLASMVEATTHIARGNLDVRVPSSGNDEIAVLAHAFNYMVTGLQEGVIYRDLLGRTVSPEVREALRRSFASGDLRLEGQNTVATVMMTDIRDFTRLSEKVEPATILNWLNEYFGELVPVVTRHNGVVDKFEGDAMLAFFGILPVPQSPKESALSACLAATEMLTVIERINQRRAERNEPPLITGISINTGSLTAGGLGTADRLNYTIIGDTVNTTQRMQDSSRGFGESGIVVSESTLAALEEHRALFQFEPLGEQAFKGKMEQIWIYRMRPAPASQRPVAE